jgi:hypothetical protein
MPAREGLLNPREQALLAARTHNSLSSQLERWTNLAVISKQLLNLTLRKAVSSYDRGN